MHNPQRTAQLLETFPLSGVMKKVQPTGDKLRCQVHRRANHSTSQVGAWSRYMVRCTHTHTPVARI